MDEKLFRKTEGKLYRYYLSKRKIYNLKDEILRLENRKTTIEHDIKHANVTIDYYQNGIGIQERVQTSPTGTSYAEQEMCREIEKLEKEHLLINKKIFKHKARISELESFTRYMDKNIEGLEEESKRFLELKYGDRRGKKNNILRVSIKMNMAQATAYRKREELVETIAEYDNTLLGKAKF